MQPRPTKAALLLVVALTATGCGQAATGSLNTPATGGRSAMAPNPAEPAGLTTTTTQTTTTTASRMASTPTTIPATPTTTAPAATAAPTVNVDEIDSLLAEFDDTLAELDQLLNQAAAAMAAEEGEILP